MLPMRCWCSLTLNLLIVWLYFVNARCWQRQGLDDEFFKLLLHVHFRQNTVCLCRLHIFPVFFSFFPCKGKQMRCIYFVACTFVIHCLVSLHFVSTGKAYLICKPTHCLAIVVVGGVVFLNNCYKIQIPNRCFRRSVNRRRIFLTIVTQKQNNEQYK